MSHVFLSPRLNNGHLHPGHALARDFEADFLVMVVVHVVMDRVVVVDIFLRKASSLVSKSSFMSFS
eukprot:3211079-Heterocapsa_arctica.AAC.1